MGKYNYTIEGIKNALFNIGLKNGDTIFIHSNIGFFGRLKDCNSVEDYYETFKEAIFEIIGDSGTMVNPTFSYSFCNKNEFNVKETPGICGVFSETARLDPDAIRSEDANFSIVAIGAKAKYLTEKVPEFSFGKNSFWDKFLKENGIIVNFNFDTGSTFIHYVERELRVPYRYDKGFPGKLIKDNLEFESKFYHFVYDLSKPEHSPDFPSFNKKAIESNLVKTANLGKGRISSITAQDTFNLIKDELNKDPNFLIKGK